MGKSLLKWENMGFIPEFMKKLIFLSMMEDNIRVHSTFLLQFNGINGCLSYTKPIVIVNHPFIDSQP